MDAYWVPGVNAHGCYGRWAFFEFRDPVVMGAELDRLARSKGRGHGVPITRDQAVNLLRRHKQTLEQRFGVVELALFGSIVRDEAFQGSDVDILVRFDNPAAFRAYFGTASYLEDVFGRRVDLVTPKALRPELRPFVEREAIYV